MALSQQYQDAYKQAVSSKDTASQQRFENMAKTLGTTVLSTPQNMAFSNSVQNGSKITAPSATMQTVSNNNPNITPAQKVTEAITNVNTNTTMPTYQPVQAVDNTAKYSDMFEKQKQSTIARIKSAISGQVSEQDSIIAGAPQRFYNPKNEASFRGAMNEEAVKEQMAGMGLAGSGDNISAGVRARASTQSALNNINQQEQDVITQAKNAIARLRQQEASDIEQASSTTDAQMLQAIINESNRISELNRADALQQYNAGMDKYKLAYGENRDKISDQYRNADYTGRLNGTQTLQGKQVESNLKTNELQQINLSLDNTMKKIESQYKEPQIKAQLDVIKEQLKSGQLANAKGTIENSYLPQQLKAQLEAIRANTAQSYASADAARTSAAASMLNAQTNANEYKAKLDAGAYNAKSTSPTASDFYNNGLVDPKDIYTGVNKGVEEFVSNWNKTYGGDSDYSKKGSLERKNAFNEIALYIDKQPLTDQQKTTLLRKAGFTEFMPK